jgi:hypothetical protein
MSENDNDAEYCIQCGYKLLSKKQTLKSWPFLRLFYYSVVTFSFFPWMLIFLIMFVASVFDPIDNNWWSELNILSLQSIFIAFALPGLILIAVSSVVYFFYPSSRLVPRRKSLQQSGQFDLKRLFFLFVILVILWTYLNISMYQPDYSPNDHKCDVCGETAGYSLENEELYIHEFCGTHAAYFIFLHPWMGLEFLVRYINSSKDYYHTYHSNDIIGPNDIIGAHLLVLFWSILTLYVIISLIVIVSKFDSEK